MRGFYKADFYTKDKNGVLETIVQIAKEKAPFGKILFICSANDFQGFGFEIVKALKFSGHKVINFLFDEDFSFSVENSCGLFCVHEDVRLCVCLGQGLIAHAKYFSFARGVCAVSVCEKPCAIDFYQTLFVENNGVLDLIDAPCDFSTIYYEPINKKDLFCLLALKRFELFDCYARTHFTNTPFYANSAKRASDLLDLAENSLVLENELGVVDALNFISCATIEFAKLFESSFARIYQGLMRKSLQYEKVFALIKFTLSSIEKAFNDNARLPADYNQRVNSLNKLTGIDELRLIKGLNEQKERFCCSDEGAFLDKLFICKEYFEQANKEYQKRGGVVKGLSLKERAVIKLSGDTPFAINLMSVLREFPF